MNRRIGKVAMLIAMRRTASSVLVALLMTVGLAVGASPAQADDSHCPDGYSCFWTSTNFSGNKVLRGAEWLGQPWQPFDNYKFSAKNRYGSNMLLVYVSGIGRWVCGLPGQRAENVPGITAFAVRQTCLGNPNWYFHY